MQTLYETNDVAEVFVYVVVDIWPKKSNSLSDWQKAQSRIQTAQNIARRLHQQRTYTWNSDLVELLEDLNVLYEVALYRCKELERQALPLEVCRTSD